MRLLEEPNEAAVLHEDPLLQDLRKPQAAMRAPPIHPHAHAMPTGASDVFCATTAQ